MSSERSFRWSAIITVFSSSRKSEVRRNSSISVKGRGGAVCALTGKSFGNSNSSSDMYLDCFPNKLDFLRAWLASCELTLHCQCLLRSGLHCSRNCKAAGGPAHSMGSACSRTPHPGDGAGVSQDPSGSLRPASWLRLQWRSLTGSDRCLLGAANRSGCEKWRC